MLWAATEPFDERHLAGGNPCPGWKRDTVEALSLSPHMGAPVAEWDQNE